MVTAELGACEWFVYELRRSNLIDRGQLDQIVGEFLKHNPRADAASARRLPDRPGGVTPFQAERVLANKAQGLVLGPYVLTDALGAGSMGTVYKAVSKTDQRIRRQGAAAAQHVERPTGPPPGAGVRPVQPPGGRAVRRRRHVRRHALPGLAVG